MGENGGLGSGKKEKQECEQEGYRETGIGKDDRIGAIYHSDCWNTATKDDGDESDGWIEVEENGDRGGGNRIDSHVNERDKRAERLRENATALIIISYALICSDDKERTS